MRGLDLARQSARHQSDLKKEKLLVLFQENASKSVLRSVLATMNLYKAKCDQFSLMYENVERLKIELVAQQQSMTVFAAFEKANTVMERIASRLNVDTLERTLESLQEKLDSGKEISLLLASPETLGGKVYDDDELDAELHLLVASSSTPPHVDILSTKGKEEEEEEKEKKGSKKQSLLA